MPGRCRRYAVISASALALALSVTTAAAQKGLIAPPVPDTPPPVPSILQNYKSVTPDRLKQPEDGDWLMYRRTYDGWGYSPLPQITAENVGKLKPVWTLATGQIEGHQAPPIVNNGVMFVGDTRKSGTGLRRQGRQSSVALQATNSRRRDVFASDQPWCRTAR